jgi:hypothetical protein
MSRLLYHLSYAAEGYRDGRNIAIPFPCVNKPDTRGEDGGRTQKLDR